MTTDRDRIEAAWQQFDAEYVGQTARSIFEAGWLAATDAIAPPAVPDREALAQAIAPDTFRQPRINLHRFAYEAAYDAADRVLKLLPEAQPAVPDDVRRLSEAAAPGTWSWEDDPPTLYAGRVDTSPVEIGGEVVHFLSHGLNLFGRLDLDSNGKSNLDFVVAAVNWVRSLLTTPAPPADTGDGEAGQRAQVAHDLYKDADALLTVRERRIAELEAEVAELQLTGDRKELRSLLDQCGLDFERMRERALAAEKRRDEACEAAVQHMRHRYHAEASLARAREVAEKLAAALDGLRPLPLVIDGVAAGLIAVPEAHGRYCGEEEPAMTTDRRVEAACRDCWIDWDMVSERARMTMRGMMTKALAAADALAPPRLDREAVASAIRSSMDDEQWCYEAADAVLALLPVAPPKDNVRRFAQAILHGDDEHRAWLTEAAEAFIAGADMPPPRGGGRP